MSLQILLRACVVVGVALTVSFASFSARAQTANNYTAGLSANNPFPLGITAGPDGNMWFTEFSGSKIGKITPSGVITEYATGISSFSNPSAIVLGADGNLWFTEQSGIKIGKITSGGVVTEYSNGITQQQGLTGIAAGPDGNLWFTENSANKIGKITTNGTVTEYAVGISAGAGLTGITAGPDGNLWFTEINGHKIGKITPSGTVTEYTTGLGTNASPSAITVGPDGNLWFVEYGNVVGKITPGGAITEYPVNFANYMYLDGISAGSDGNLWLTGVNGTATALGRITTTGAFTDYSSLLGSTVGPQSIAAGPDGALWITESEPGIARVQLAQTSSNLAASILPTSRSVGTSTVATAFATIVNAGANAALGCQISPVTSVAANFAYQTSDSSTNALTGVPNTPVSIPAGRAQSFVISFTPNAAFAPANVNFSFICTGQSPAATYPGVNTLLFSASTTPVPDMIALAATQTGDGIVAIPGTNGSNAFAVATVNIGSGASITATANTGSTTLPLTLTICQTNPSTSVCLAAPAASVTTTINTNSTPTFAIFATASGAIPFAPATSRVFVQFSDSSAVVRGMTSVAVRTQ